MRGRIEQVEIRDLLESIEQSLKSIETMRDEIAEQFDRRPGRRQEDRDRPADRVAACRSNLERQRLLFNTVVDQLKQAKLVGDFSSIRSEIIEPANALPAAGPAAGVLDAGHGPDRRRRPGRGLPRWSSDLLDPRIRSLEEMRRVIRFPVLGQVPQLADSAGRRGEPGRPDQPRACPDRPSAEAFKVVRANLDRSRRNQDVRVILVTSPRPGEGKTTVASNLAICLAQAGRRVLLVDADLRRPDAARDPRPPARARARPDPPRRHVARPGRADDRGQEPRRRHQRPGDAQPGRAALVAAACTSSSPRSARTTTRSSSTRRRSSRSPTRRSSGPWSTGSCSSSASRRPSETTRPGPWRLLKGLGTPVLGGLINGIGPEPDPRPWVPSERGGGVTDRYVREIRIDSQLIFVPGADYRDRPPAMDASPLHPPTGRDRRTRS